MKAASFDYVRAGSLAEAFELRRGTPEISPVLAGGQSLMSSLAFRLSQPARLVDISRIPELQGISGPDAGWVRVGALTTHTELGASAIVRRHVPLLAEAIPLIAHPAIRNRGTIGGSLAYADPSAELPACAVALGARVVAVGPDGRRTIAAERFFTGLFATALGPHELIEAIEFPEATEGQRSIILEVSRRSGDYAIVGVVAIADVDGNGVTRARLVYFGVGDGPVEAAAAAMALGSYPWSSNAIAAAQTALDGDLHPVADLHGGPEFRRHLARVLLARAVARLQSPKSVAPEGARS